MRNSVTKHPMPPRKPRRLWIAYFIAAGLLVSFVLGAATANVANSTPKPYAFATAQLSLQHW